MENIKAFIFDLDGTLIDTEKIYRRVWPLAVAEMGHEMTDAQYLQMRSLGRPFVLEKIRGWYGEDFDYDGVRKIRKGYFDAHINEHGIDRKPGAIELLKYLRSKGIVTAIATATDPQRAAQYMEMAGLTGYFDKVISATMVDEGKPSPKVYLYACEQLGLKPDECVAVEDAPNGIKSASRAGLTVIMVPDQTEPEEELLPLIDYKVKSLDEIISLI